MKNDSRTFFLSRSKDYRLAIVVFAALLVLAWPHPTLAIPATCPGTCMSNGNCQNQQSLLPAVQSYETKDCPIKDKDGNLTENTCCVPPPPKPPEVPAATCTDSGGYCSLDCPGSEKPIGTFDCPELEKCCKAPTNVPVALPGTAASGTAGGAGQAAAEKPKALGIIPADVTSCIKTGDCSLDQIVRTGVGFADFLAGLSGALFLVIFIYGGALYLLSFGNKEWVTKGTNAIKGAAIGMVIVLAAWTIVMQIVKGISGTAGGGAGGTAGAKPPAADKCGAQGEGYSCQTFEGKTATEVMQAATGQGLTCKTGFCAGDFHTICCKTK
jgi:hypothetical protein